MRAVTFYRFGGPEVLEQTILPSPLLAAGQVRIAVRAAGMNHADLMQRAGRYTKPAPLPAVPGIECAGIISEVAPDVTEWAVGDRVCTITAGGGYATEVVVLAAHLLPVPKGLDLVSAATLPEAAFTVWSTLLDACGLRAGEVALIHGGAGGIGAFAIQTAAAFGAQVFTTCSQAKTDFCRALGAVRAIDYRVECFEDIVLAEAGGAHVILDNMGASYMRRNLQALAPDGRIALIGLQGGQEVTLSLREIFAKRAALFATSLRDRSDADKARIAQGVRRDIWPLLESGRLRPTVDRVFPIEDVQAAHHYMEAGTHTGKIALTFNSDN